MIHEHKLCEQLAAQYPNYFHLETVETVRSANGQEPIFSFSLCDARVRDASLPALGLFSGIHGIEAIGVKVVINFLEHLLDQTQWNEQLCHLLQSVKIFGIPVVNPVGYLEGTRSNGRGVDLMRNAPVESAEQIPFLGGQSFSRSLPYYRGFGDWEREALALCSLVQRECQQAPFVATLDVHSGFGFQDSLWTPYAKKKGVPPTWREYLNFKAVLDTVLKYHLYRFEPQSLSYCTSGDLWDFLYDESAPQRKNGRIFLPFTLEIGSWSWVKKSPRESFSLRALFNPVHPHRERRVLRRHLPFLNLLLHAVANYRNVFCLNDGESNL